MVENLFVLLARCGLWLLGFGSGAHSIRSEVRALRRLGLDSPKVAFDIGANKGEYTKAILNNFCSIQEVHQFEPNNELVSAFLSKQDQRVIVNASAVGSSVGEANLYKVPGLSGLSSLTKRDLSHHGLAASDSDLTAVNTLDNYCSALEIAKIDILKIDVEGHELDVLLGAEKLISADSIKYVQFEFGGCNVDTRTFLRDFWNLLVNENGFEVFRITPFGPIRVHKYHEIYEQFLTTNYIARK